MPARSQGIHPYKFMKIICMELFEADDILSPYFSGMMILMDIYFFTFRLLFTDLTCSSDENYETCTTSCPTTCPGRAFSPPCDDRCVEGCACDDGYILDVDACVPVSECQCQRSGVFYPVCT